MALDKLGGNSFSTGAIANSLGYTPANKAGDTFTGAVTVNGTTTVVATSPYLSLGNGSELAKVYWDNATNNFELNQVYNGPLIIKTNNAERVRVAANGFVGIGITSPTSTTIGPTLHIGRDGANDHVGTIRLSHYKGSLGNSRAWDMFVNDIDNFVIRDAGPGRDLITLANTGYVAMGVTNTITASAYLTLGAPIDSAAYGSGTRMIDFKSYYPGYDVDTIKASIYAGVSGSGTLNTQGGYLGIMTANNGTLAERLRIDKDGQLSAVIPGGATLYPSYTCRAWVNFDGTGATGNKTLRGNGNISSVSKTGTGGYTVNFSSAMPDINYTVVSGSSNDAGAVNNGQFTVLNIFTVTGSNYVAPTTTSFSVAAATRTGGYIDPVYVTLAVFR